MKMKQTNKSSLDEKIHVAFCIDKNYTIQVLLVINSILINNKSKSRYKFYIIENNLSKLDKLHIKLFVKFHGQEVEIINVDTTEIDAGENLYTNNIPYSVTTYITRIGTARILLPQILQDLKKILYLDADTLVLADLKSLWNVNIEDYAAAMSCHYRDNQDKKNSYVKKIDDYFNIGVLLINMEKWRKENITDEIIKLLKNNKYAIPDQDSMNEVLKGQIKEIPYIWNATYMESLDLNILSLNYLKILHYFYKPKPWTLLFYDKNIFANNYLYLYFKNWNSSYLRIFKVKYLRQSFKNFIKKNG